jgi:hypothetical protein
MFAQQAAATAINGALLAYATDEIAKTGPTHRFAHCTSADAAAKIIRGDMIVEHLGEAMIDPLADAQAWYDRGQAHIEEYRKSTYEEKSLTLHKDRLSETHYRYSLHLNRDLLVRLKPIACEVGNALFQSLDNIIAIGARQDGVKRSPRVSWPWAIEPDPNSNLADAVQPAIDEKLKELEREGVPPSWLDLIVKTFASPTVGLQHIDVLKEVSLSGKHWALIPTRSSAHAIAWRARGSTEQSFADVPDDVFEGTDEFVFHEGEKNKHPIFRNSNERALECE